MQIMPLCSCFKLLIVSTHMIYQPRAPRMVSRPAEGGCFCLATVSVFSFCPAPGAAQVQVTAVAYSLAQESTPQPTSPLSRVTATAFLLASEYATASSLGLHHYAKIFAYYAMLQFSIKNPIMLDKNSYYAHYLTNYAHQNKMNFTNI